jgi:hypothetical protein
VLEAVAAARAAREPGGEHHPVVGQRGGGNTVSGGGLAEGGQHDRTGDPVVRGHREREPGMVVEPAQDLHIRARGAVGAGQPVVGEVRLPGLVGLLGGEPQVGAPRSLLRFRRHESPSGQQPSDRGPADLEAMVVTQVPADGVRAGVEALLGQLLAEPDDPLHRGLGGGVR